MTHRTRHHHDKATTSIQDSSQQSPNQPQPEISMLSVPMEPPVAATTVVDSLRSPPKATQLTATQPFFLKNPMLLVALWLAANSLHTAGQPMKTTTSGPSKTAPSHHQINCNTQCCLFRWSHRTPPPPSMTPFEALQSQNSYQPLKHSTTLSMNPMLFVALWLASNISMTHRTRHQDDKATTSIQDSSQQSPNQPQPEISMLSVPMEPPVAATTVVDSLRSPPKATQLTATQPFVF